MEMAKRMIRSIDVIYPKEDRFLSVKWTHPNVEGHTKQILTGFRWCGIHLVLYSTQKEGEIWIGSYLRRKDGKVGNKICFFTNPKQVYMKEIRFHTLFGGFQNDSFGENSLMMFILNFIKELSNRSLRDLPIEIDLDVIRKLFRDQVDPFFDSRSHAMDFFKRSSSELLICREALEKRYELKEAPETSVFVDFRKLNVVKFMDRNGSKIGSLDINFHENVMYTELQFGGNLSYCILHFGAKIPIDPLQRRNEEEEFSAYLTAATDIIRQMQESTLIQFYFDLRDMKMLESNLRSTIAFQKKKMR